MSCTSLCCRNPTLPERALGLEPTGERYCSHSVEHESQVLVGQLAGGEPPAGAIPAHRDPDRVTDEPVRQLRVEVGAQLTARDALADHLHPKPAHGLLR